MKSHTGSLPLRIVRTQVVEDEGPGMLPGATLAANGDLLVSYNTTVDGYAGGEAYLVRSADRGYTWETPELVAQTQRAGATHTTIGMCTLPDGAILYPYIDVRREPDGSRTAVLHILKSADNGHRWEKREPVDIDMSLPVSYGKIILPGDGMLLCPIDGQRRREEGSRSGLLRSVDNGQTWGAFTTIAYEPAVGGEGGFNETSVIELPDGDLLAILRQEKTSPDGRLEPGQGHDLGWAARAARSQRVRILPRTEDSLRASRSGVSGFRQSPRRPDIRGLSQPLRRATLPIAVHAAGIQLVRCQQYPR